MAEQVADIEVAEAAVELTAPSREFAEHATRRVEWADRFCAFRMAAGAGTLSSELYSFAEIGYFIMGTRWAQAIEPDAKVSFNWVNMTKLAAWFEDVAGDNELADAVREAVPDPGVPFKVQVDAVGPILVARYQQYLDVLDPKAEEVKESE